jgi:hypothetical protein
MFNNRKIKRLEAKIESLQSLINPVKYTFKTGKKITASSPYGGIYQFDETKSIPINDLLTMILDHIGLDIKVIEGTSEKIELVKKAKVK